ncbi:hypothetical protein [Streptomyces caatingaensis]|uniref:hypothetical protein n=1 Tax=Streptomyces caatingaensis TaxID=1678637 RepID=UPI003BB1C719
MLADTDPFHAFEDVRPALDRLDLLVPPVADALRAWHGPVPAERVLYVDTAPEVADTAVLVEHYGAALLERSANRVVVAAGRAGATTPAACGYRADRTWGRTSPRASGEPMTRAREPALSVTDTLPFRPETGAWSSEE